ncbi:hypothetical protein F01_430064 [Burkholderia cenocepacia]|nr:hypothetical protein F01_430064 [Burkholderia cenocepacia]
MSVVRTFVYEKARKGLFYCYLQIWGNMGHVVGIRAFQSLDMAASFPDNRFFQIRSRLFKASRRYALQTTLSNAIDAGNPSIAISRRKQKWEQKFLSTYRVPASVAQCSASPWC